MKTTLLPCGCRHERERQRWVELCPEHEREAAELHERAARERYARVISGTGNAAERRELGALCRVLSGKALP